MNHANPKTIHYKCNNDMLWSMIEVNPVCADVVGYPYEELISNKITFGHLIVKKDKNRVKNIVECSLSARQPFQIEYEIKAGTGEIKMLYEQGHGIYDSNNRLIFLSGFITDITNDKFVNPEISINSEIIIQKWMREIQKTLPKLNTCNVKLSEKEINIMLYFSQGMSMKEIAKYFTLSPRTIEAYLNRVKEKLGCRLKTELRRLFFETETGKELILNALKHQNFFKD